MSIERAFREWKHYRMFVFLYAFICIGRLASGQDLENNRSCQLSISTVRMGDEGKQISVERLVKESGIVRAKIIALHGADGVLSHSSPAYDNLGEHYLACQGYEVFLPHYLETTGTKSVPDFEFAMANSKEWKQVLQVVVRTVNVDQKPLIVIGNSLGSYLALAIGSEHGVSALVLISGGDRGLPEKFALPKDLPILELVGDRDALIGLVYARRLDDLLKRNGCDTTFLVYKDAGHSLFFERQESVLSAISSFLSLQNERLSSTRMPKRN